MGKRQLTEKERKQRSAAAKSAAAKKTPEERRALGRRGATVHWADRLEPPKNAALLIQEASENGCTHGQIAEALGVGRGLLRRWLEKYPELQAAMGEGRQVEHDKLVGKLMELAMKGNLVAILASLKMRHGYREGEAPVTNTISVNFILPKSLSPDEYAAKVARESQLLPGPEAARLAQLPEVKRELAKDLKAAREEEE